MPPQLLTRAGTKLALWDLGGNGPPALLIHGLAGHAGEWDDTATWLRETRHEVTMVDPLPATPAPPSRTAEATTEATTEPGDG